MVGCDIHPSMFAEMDSRPNSLRSFQTVFGRFKRIAVSVRLPIRRIVSNAESDQMEINFIAPIFRTKTFLRCREMNQRENSHPIQCTDRSATARKLRSYRKYYVKVRMIDPIVKLRPESVRERRNLGLCNNFRCDDVHVPCSQVERIV